MKEEGKNPPYEAIIFLQVNAIASTSNQKMGTCKLNLYLRRGKQPSSSRLELASRHCTPQEERQSIGEAGLALVRKEDAIEIQLQQEGGSKAKAYSKLTLDKLIEIPKVKHQVECLLVEKNWDRFFEGPLRNIAQLDLAIISFPAIAGKFVVSSFELALSKASSSAVMELQGQTKRVECKGGDEKTWQWSENTEFEVNDLNKSFSLSVTVYNREGICLGKQSIDLIQTLMLIPEESPSPQTLKIISPTKENIGTFKIEYQFVPSLS